ncbi:Mitochondrial import inner membrane translocase subunit Tim13 [Cricetulus griseus]|uniref:Mitochondrial import inner membrane translocase subunit n=1 Tax=Cricetulus griseus TaxID=10029 RepID=G3HFC2_CRIGR|nr:Mitochondrial import inner membrane translocase subunit Tim13 [Cricetulus griseus]
MTDKCFRKCIGKPGGSLDNSEQVRRPGTPGWWGAQGKGFGACSAASPSRGVRVRGRRTSVSAWCICSPSGRLRGHVTLTHSGVPLPALQKCIAMCMDRYMDAWNTVSRAYNSRLQRERANM